MNRLNLPVSDQCHRCYTFSVGRNTDLSQMNIQTLRKTRRTGDVQFAVG